MSIFQAPRPGILPAQSIETLIATGAITSDTAFDHDQVQPASLDLRLSDQAWRVRASFLPGKRKVEERIADGTYAPGTRLDEVALAKEFGVSRTPIRETLIQLSSSGMIDLRPRRGAVVVIEFPDGRTESHSLSTRVPLPRGTVVHLRSGSGGGHGDPALREVRLIRRDLDEGYISAAHVEQHYPHFSRADA